MTRVDFDQVGFDRVDFERGWILIVYHIKQYILFIRYNRLLELVRFSLIETYLIQNLTHCQNVSVQHVRSKTKFLIYFLY